jgi:MFS family permease
LLGALIVGGPGDRYGSRNMLRVVGMLYVISALGCALAWSLTSFALCRFLAGIAIGGSSVPAPIFLDEIASAFAFFFASMMVLQFIAAFFLMPETRGVALERMNEQLGTAERKVSRRNM